MFRSYHRLRPSQQVRGRVRFHGSVGEVLGSRPGLPAAHDVSGSVYDPDVNRGAVAWFKSSAAHLLSRVDGYLELLAAHGVPCESLESSEPGRIVYEDPDQIVVVPL